ncbi:anthrone oxygenase family protein [Streptacidiphilus anmyonensis]|uniref:anthrone oxygenase family protein n=1 Tax=Streptacidiphilus anmyonensis TaxID=405782 RepID=UPI0005A98098|nr:anthrone oxygenase family protein [Streptacidiphilus anmyonensis]
MRSERAATALRFVSLVLAGLFAGFLVTVLVFELSLHHFDASVYTQTRQIELLRLDDLASATLLPTLPTTAILAAMSLKARDRTFWLTATAFALLLSVVATTVVFNLPINSDQLHWNVQTPPADWASVRDRWQIAHAVRTAAAVVAFGLLSAAAMTPTRSTHRPSSNPTPAAVPAPQRTAASGPTGGLS